MTIWAVPVRSMGVYHSDPEVLEKTVELYCVGRGRKPFMFIGIIPTSLALKSGFVWIQLIGPPPLKQLRRAWPRFVQLLGWNLIAFTKSDFKRESRFMEFFGLEKTETVGEYTFYRSKV